MDELEKLVVKNGELIVQNEDGSHRPPNIFEMKYFICSEIPEGRCDFDYIYDRPGKIFCCCALRFNDGLLYRLKLFFKHFRFWDYSCCDTSKEAVHKEVCMWLIKRRNLIKGEKDEKEN